VQRETPSNWRIGLMAGDHGVDLEMPGAAGRWANDCMNIRSVDAGRNRASLDNDMHIDNVAGGTHIRLVESAKLEAVLFIDHTDVALECVASISYMHIPSYLERGINVHTLTVAHRSGEFVFSINTAACHDVTKLNSFRWSLAIIERVSFGEHSHLPFCFLATSLASVRSCVA
jgi:hypothetical protein